eukprot:TRINITY_DN4537_c0_g1_i1.p1 TRINITY_DN4537_c0_g1~~TRINITY_DN4537_c0_g1_i1.p1  ORF type:complete len:545 (-),score=69.50 TRINITY_DN4537_c0_g1_i1:88-1722(-)
MRVRSSLHLLFRSQTKKPGIIDQLKSSTNPAGLWRKVQRDHPVTEPVLCQAIRVINNSKEVVRILHDSPLKSVDIYNNVLSVLRDKNTPIRVVSQLFDEMIQNDFTPNKFTLGIVSQIILNKKGNLDLLNEEANKQISQLSNKVYGQVMKNPKVDVGVYNLLVQIFGSYDLKLCLDLLEKMRANNIQPDSFTYNMLIQFCHKHKNNAEAIKLFERAKSEGIAVDSFLFRSFLLNGGIAPSTASNILENEPQEPNNTKSLALFLALMNTLTRQGSYEEAMNVIPKMIKKGIEPNLHVYNKILEIFVASDRIKRAFELYEYMKTLPKELNPDKYSLTSIVGGLVKKGLFAQAFQWFAYARPYHGRNIDISIFNVLLSSHNKSGQNNEEIEQIFEDLKTNPTLPKPDLITYTTMMGHYRRRGEYEKVLSLFEEIEKIGTPSSHTYSILLKALAEMGRLNDAWIVFSKLDGKKLTNPLVVHKMIESFINSSEVDQAVAVLNHARKQKIGLLVWSYKIVIKALKYRDDYQTADKIAQQARDDGFVVEVM